MHEQSPLAVTDSQARRPIATALAVRSERARHEVAAISKPLWAPAAERNCDLGSRHADLPEPASASIRSKATTGTRIRRPILIVGISPRAAAAYEAFFPRSKYCLPAAGTLIVLGASSLILTVPFQLQRVSFISLLSSLVTDIPYIRHTAETASMAQLPAIQLDWWKDPKGYRLEETKAGHLKFLRIVRNGRPRDKLVLCRPLDSSDMLFRKFANTATTPEGVLKFVQSFGPLMGDDEGDLVSEVIHRAFSMQGVLKWVATQPRQPTRGDEAFFGPGVTLHAWLGWDAGSNRPLWQFRPATLFDGLWLQFAQAVARGIHVRTCMHCGNLFETGQGTGRRLDAKFCSDEHRIAFNSLKRSKEK
jgi:hypothetical protein